jgi:hypothetical protein
MEFRQNPYAEWTSAEWTAANGPLPTHSDKKDGKEGKNTGMTHPAPKKLLLGADMEDWSGLHLAG